MALKAFKAGNDDIVDNSGGKADKTVVDLSKFKNNKFKKLTYIPNIGAIRELIFLIPNTQKTFNYLKQMFIKAPIF